VKRSLKILAYGAFVLLVCLGLAEIGARILFPTFAEDELYLNQSFSRLLNSEVVHDPLGDNYSEKFGFVLTPETSLTHSTPEYTYTSTTNSLGFRSKEIAPRGDDEYRVMLIGDSMFWGIGVEMADTIPSIIEKEGRPGVSVHNFSIVGYNTVQELVVAKSYVDSVEPDLIVLGVFVGNDILTNALTYEDQAGHYRVSDEKRQRMRDDLHRSFGPFFCSTVFRIPAFAAYVPRVRYRLATRDDIMADTLGLIGEVGEVAADRGVGLLVVILYPRDAVAGGIVEAWSNSRQSGELIEAFCKRQGITVLDLLDYMNTPEQADEYFFPEDGHPNAAGNVAIADAILDRVPQLKSR